MTERTMPQGPEIIERLREMVPLLNDVAIFYSYKPVFGHENLFEQAALTIEELQQRIDSLETIIEDGKITGSAQAKQANAPKLDEVICPNCCHQFRAIPQDVHEQLAAMTAERDRLRRWMRSLRQKWLRLVT